MLSGYLSAMMVVTNRERIRKKVSDLVESIALMEQRSRQLGHGMAHGSGHSNSPGGHAQAELHAEQLDEEIHRFQYNLDHCRR